MVKKYAKWHKEEWRDHNGKSIGYVLVKRDKGKITSIIYPRSIRNRKKYQLMKGRRSNHH